MHSFLTGLMAAVFADRRGVATLEYGLLAAFAVAAVATIAAVLSQNVSNLFASIRIP